MRSRCVRLALLSFCVLAALWNRPARAADESRVYQLADTVNVTVDRLPLDPLRLPMAATTIGAEAIATSRQGGIDDALGFVPGVLAQTRAGGPDVRITMRGFGARGAGERSNSGTTRGIRILLDGFPLTEPDGRTALDLADLGGIDRVEVVRSNASALFGSSAGGLIQLVSDADFARPFVDARFVGGSFGYKRGQASGGFNTGSAKIHLAGTRTLFDGWRKHSAVDAGTVEASALIDPAPRTQIGVFFTGARTLTRQAGPLTKEKLDEDPRQADSTFVARNERRENTIGRLAARLRHGFNETSDLRIGIFAEPKTLRRSERNRYRDFQRVHAGGDGLYRLSFRAGEKMRAAWTVGFDEAYQDGSILFYNLGPNGSRGTDLIANKREGINTFGVYSEFVLEPIEQVAVNVGARYDVVRYIFEDYIDPKLDDSRDLKKASPRVGVTWRWSDNHAVYAALHGGIETPAYNEIDPPAPYDTLTGLNPLLDPTTSTTFEIGTKGKLVRSGGYTARYDAAIYHIKVKNDIVPWNGGAYYFTAGESKRSGFELGGDVTTPIGVSARLAVNVSDNKYVHYENDLGVFDDNKSAGIAPQVISASLRYDAPLGLYGEAVYRRVGSYYADDANTVKIPTLQQVDGTVGIERAVGRSNLGIFLSARNLTDEKSVGSAYINGVNGQYYEPAMERNYLVGVSVRAVRS
jgi:iron complex outermembrane recepter protein